MARNDNMIAALLRERATYEHQGKQDRVRQVDDQLEHYGYEPEADEQSGPQGRTETPLQTAAAGAPPSAKKTAAKKTAAAAPPTE